MQATHLRHHLGLPLAVALASSLCLGQANAYPTGGAVSFGANPVVSTGGTAYSGSPVLLFTAPADQDLVLTDVVLTSFSQASCKRSHHTTLKLDSGDTVASFETNSSFAKQYYDYVSSSGLSVQQTFSAGLVVSAGSTLTIEVTQTNQFGTCSSDTSYGVRYTISGYHTRP